MFPQSRGLLKAPPGLPVHPDTGLPHSFDRRRSNWLKLTTAVSRLASVLAIPLIYFPLKSNNRPTVAKFKKAVNRDCPVLVAVDGCHWAVVYGYGPGVLFVADPSVFGETEKKSMTCTGSMERNRLGVCIFCVLPPKEVRLNKRSQSFK